MIAGNQSAVVSALAELDEETRAKVIESLPLAARRKLVYDWSVWGRPDQQWRPGKERHTVFLAGRGWGKTRTGGEALRHLAYHAELIGGRKRKNHMDRSWGDGARMGIAGRTANDVNETILNGESGIITKAPPWFRPVHEVSRRRIVWPNGTEARLFSGDTPASFRGPNIAALWADELAHWARAEASWLNAMLALRLGKKTYSIVTTTPIPCKALLDLLYEKDRANGGYVEAPEPGIHRYKLRDSVRVVHGSTYDNAANLADDYLEDTIGMLEGTQVGEQEIHGAILLDVPGAPWSTNWFRRCEHEDVPELVKIVVAVDPSTAEEGKNAECGIIVAGMAATGEIYVLDDLSAQLSPNEWAKRAIKAYKEYDADSIVVEANVGLAETTIKNAHEGSRRLKIQPVTATKSKHKRAQLVNILWENGKVYHVGNPRKFVQVENQMTHFDPQNPKAGLVDRMDAIVWAALGLRGGGSDRRALKALGDKQAWAKIQARVAGGATKGRIISLHRLAPEQSQALADLFKAAA